MKNSISFITALCLFLGSVSLFSQSASKLSFSAGIGVLPTFIADDAEVNTPPLNARLTYQMTPAFSLSAFAGYSSSTSTTPAIISDGQQILVSNKQTLLGLRGELKKSISEKFEIYGGAMLGYNHSNIREFDKFSGETVVRDPEAPTPFDPNRPDGELLYSGFVGTTYFVHNKIGVFGEIGYGVSLLNAGITIKI
ncbi:MAG: outer membrane beta-barrel protein [Bacteroidota bacterium]